LRRAGDAEEHDIGRANQRCDILRFLRAAFHEIVDGLPVAMAEHGERKAFFHDVLRHAMAHEADADEADAFVGHRVLVQI